MVSGTSTKPSVVSLTPITTTTTATPQTNDVDVNITWTYLNGVTNVKMTVNNLKISQWIALGLSLDELMVLNSLILLHQTLYFHHREKIMYLFVNIYPMILSLFNVTSIQLVIHDLF